MNLRLLIIDKLIVISPQPQSRKLSNLPNLFFIMSEISNFFSFSLYLRKNFMYDLEIVGMFNYLKFFKT